MHCEIGEELELTQGSVVIEAWVSKDTMLIRQLDADLDPYLHDVLGGAGQRGHRAALQRRPAGGALVGAFEHVRDNRVPRSVIATVEQLAAHASLALRNAWLLHDVEELAVTDELTRLANRRQFESALSSELAAAKADGTPLGFILVDLDRFKALNDTHGHLTGDEVLRRVSDVLVGVTELGDTVARYGGEEFALVLPGRDPVATAAMAERARLAIATLRRARAGDGELRRLQLPGRRRRRTVAHARGRRGHVRVEAVRSQPGDVGRRSGQRLARPAVALGRLGRRPLAPRDQPPALNELSGRGRRSVRSGRPAARR